MTGVKAVNLGLRFLLEICALVALGYWGFQAGKTGLTKGLLGIGTPLLAAVIWGIFGSPAAPYPASTIMRLFLEIMILGSAAIALYSSGHQSLSVSFAILSIINKVLMYIWNQ